MSHFKNNTGKNFTRRLNKDASSGSFKNTPETGEESYTGKISILIPCHNEEKTIKKCIQSCLNQTKKADQIVVVNDGSTDNSSKILCEFGDKITVVHLKKNTGNKSLAQEVGLKYITGDVFITTDADTVLDKRFIEYITRPFTDDKVSAAGGYVIGTKHNWVTACRELDYIIGQNFHKVAQAHINCLFVIPGCAGAFRTNIFKENISFDHDTLTEDLDFTYKFNKRGFHIFYERKAKVYTQDPSDISSYINQMRRWYSGGWQNLNKHINIFNKSNNALELSLIYIEGFIFATLIYILPIINIYLYVQFMGLFLLYSTVLGVYGAIIRKRLDLFLYSPMYIFLFYINAYVFISAFVREILKKEKNLTWFKPIRRII